MTSAFGRWWSSAPRPVPGIIVMSVSGHDLPVPAQQLQVGYQSSNGQAQPRSNAAWPLLFFLQRT